MITLRDHHFKGIQIDINVECNLMCYNCNRSCRQAPSNEMMTIDQIKKFIDESIQANYCWPQIDILGGEPTLHPKFLDIVQLFNDYRQVHNPNCVLKIVTNGYTDETNRLIDEANKITHLWVENTFKKSVVQSFNPFNVAPIDTLSDIDYSADCWILQLCGKGLSFSGYYLCAVAASIDRIFGFDIGLKHLTDINQDALKKQLIKLCPLCGHWQIPNDKYVNEEIMSKTWVEAYARYKQCRPRLSLY